MCRFFFFVLFLPVILCENIRLNSTCSLYNSSGCPENLDDDLTTPQMIRRHGYPAQSHFVTTEDGYILTLHRIPASKTGKKGSQPVFLQHGYLGSSTCFVSQGVYSLGFILADAGYDVWLGNARGNEYSKAHVNLSIHSAQYWNFSWHEMGIYDLPAALGYVSNVTNKPGEIIYIGHSMGTTMFFVFASMRPHSAKTVKLMAAFAPVAYLSHLWWPLRLMTPFLQDAEWVAKHLGINEFSPSTELSKFLAHDCELLSIERDICENIFFILGWASDGGIDADEFRAELLSVALAHNPAGSSTKAGLHYCQEGANGGRFQQYDYGSKGNLIKYGTPTPPEYEVRNIKVKTYLMASLGDVATSYKDVIRLSRNLTNLVGLYLVPLPGFDHIDYLFGKHVVELVYKPLMRVMMNFTQGVDINKLIL